MKKISSDVILRIIHFILGLVLFLVPIFFVPFLLTPFVVPRTFLFIFLVEVASFFYLYLALVYPEYRPRNSFIFYGFLSFIFVNILSGVFGADPSFSFWSSSIRFDGILLLIHVLLLFLVVAFTVKTKKILNILIWSSVLSSILVAFSVYFIYVDTISFGFLVKMFSGQALGGTLGNNSYTGVYLLFNIFFIFYLFLNAKRKRIKYLLGGMLIFIFLSPIFFNFDIFRGLISFRDLLFNPMLLIGTARGAFFSIILGVILTVLFLFVNNSKKLIRLSSRISITIFLSTIVVFIVLLFVSGSSVHKWFGGKAGVYRFTYWHQAMEGFKEHPALGWGPGNFILINEKYFEPWVFNNDYSASEAYSDKAHNILLDILATTGLLGLLSYLSIFIASLFVLLKSKKILHPTKAIIIGLIFAYVIQNLIFFDILVSYMMFAFLLAIIVILDRGQEESSPPDIKYLPNRKHLILFLVILLFAVISMRYFIFRPLKEVYLNHVFYNLPGTVHNSYPESRDFSNFGTSRDVERYAFYVFDKYLGIIDSIKNERNNIPYLVDIDNSIEDIIKNSQTSGITFQGAHTIFQLYDIRYQMVNDNSTLPRMRWLSEKEIDLSPENIRGYLDNARVFYYEGKYLEAINVLENTLLFDPSNARVHYIIIDIARKTNNPKLIKEKIKQAEASVPSLKFK